MDTVNSEMNILILHKRALQINIINKQYLGNIGA